jgi:hypothetical protein
VVVQKATGASEFVVSFGEDADGEAFAGQVGAKQFGDSAVSVSATSTAGDEVSFRLAVSCSREVSAVSSDSVTRGAS